MNSSENEQLEKAAFAAILLKERDPFRAALELFPENTNRALWIAHHWPKDAEVIEHQQRLKAEGVDMANLPDKVELARDIWDKMQGKRSDGLLIPPSPDDYAKLAKLYAEVRGFIEKQQNNNNVNVIIPKVMEIPTYETDEAWEAAAAKQQRDLLNVSRSRH